MPRTEQQILERVYERSAQITRRRRTSLVLTVGLALLLLAGVPFMALRDAGTSSTQIGPLAPRVSARPTAKPTAPPNKDPDRAPADRETAGSVTPAPKRVPDDAPARERPAGMCDPIVVDEEYDVKADELDLISSSMANTSTELVVTHELRDVTDVYSSGETRVWDLSFFLGGSMYTVRASETSEPMGWSQTFQVLRNARSGATLSGDGEIVMDARGKIDVRADEVSVTVDISRFNDAEAGRARIASGTRLDKVEAWTKGKLAAEGDHAVARCPYVVG